MNRLMTSALLAVALSLGGCATNNVLEASSSGTKAGGQWMADQSKSSEQKGNTILAKGWKFGSDVNEAVGGFLDRLTGKKSDTAQTTGNRTGTDRVEGK